ncbi:hypothetical protein LEP1GSC188_2508 [Leptospira weilii serovar Topaz str. LT2116]|uniref:Uncharacterized protein n=4 Tax=Leptospira weilii TaxID=28184 RepID=M3FID0_9LEPT|nr:hypothetical protein LEP1GSC036_0066 [Leptospira weilii str. 2006001853]EMF80222.1 hypothetical protein LEP1GSC188_2508 [Leptospira weilii serovar Topaz str. LT2116]EMJ62129.1 hypothetical protein LEP1GSC051_2003 [Leptospira sp. P2653]EMM72600.1 hypothetical protein LEP1GSC038_1893 [Leptospira weilii str. 2006001855]EMN43769.1 hypothetical protein LEP1GSC086_4570 [Leptospira weilii str. LNT 1234]EMN91619.1 hypothetical protein LEP1GSC108_4917 [Leptospira weilii str. UI 13098]
MKVGFISARVPTIIGFYKKILSYQKEQRISQQSRYEAFEQIRSQA